MFTGLTFLFLVIVGGIAIDARQVKTRSSPIERTVVPFNHENEGLDWCPQCINTFDDVIQVVLNIILDGGIVGTCSELGNLVTEKTGSGLLGFFCTMGCDFLGLEEYVKLVQAADIDPIFYCETVKLCPVNDNGDAKFRSVACLPSVALTGSKIDINIMYYSTNGTGTGELFLSIQTVDKIPVASGFLLEAQKPGSYAERITIDTTEDPDCDPTRSQCELWLQGTYNVTVMLCNGQCGAHHPHTAVYDTGSASFTLHE